MPTPEFDSEFHFGHAPWRRVQHAVPYAARTRTLHVSVRSSAIPPSQEILAGWLLRDVGRTQLEPALRQLQHSARAVTAASGDGGLRQDGRDDPVQVIPSSPKIGDEGCSIDAEAVDSLLRWARLDVRATHYGMKSDLVVQS